MEELVKATAVSGAAGATGTVLAGPLGALGGSTGALLMVLGSMQPRMAAVLAGNPAFKAWAFKAASDPSGLGAKLSGLAALAATAGPDVANAISEFAGELERANAEAVPGPQAGATDFSGPLPQRTDRKLEEQRALAKRLMLG